jgi:hypothetical protein
MRSRGFLARPGDSQPALIAQAFDAVSAVIRAHETDDDKERSSYLGLALRQTLLALVAEGVTDAEQLRNKALQRLPLTAPVVR